MQSKVWWKSKTLVINVLLLALDVINGLYGAVEVPAQVKLYVALVVNVILRLLTDRPVSVRS